MAFSPIHLPNLYCSDSGGCCPGFKPNTGGLSSGFVSTPIHSAVRVAGSFNIFLIGSSVSLFTPKVGESAGNRPLWYLSSAINKSIVSIATFGPISAISRNTERIPSCTSLKYCICRFLYKRSSLSSCFSLASVFFCLFKNKRSSLASGVSGGLAVVGYSPPETACSGILVRSGTGGTLILGSLSVTDGGGLIFRRSLASAVDSVDFSPGSVAIYFFPLFLRTAFFFTGVFFLIML